MPAYLGGRSRVVLERSEKLCDPRSLDQLLPHAPACIRRTDPFDRSVMVLRCMKDGTGRMAEELKVLSTCRYLNFDKMEGSSDEVF